MQSCQQIVKFFCLLLFLTFSTFSMTSYQTFQQILTTLPNLCQCKRLSQSTFHTLYGLLHELRGTCIDELQPLTDIITLYISRGEDLMAEQLDNLTTRSAYLTNITQSFATEWSEKQKSQDSALPSRRLLPT